MSAPKTRIKVQGKTYTVKVVQSTRKKANEVKDVFKAHGKKAVVRKFGKLGNYAIYVQGR